MCDHSCLEVTTCAFYRARWSFCGLPKRKHHDNVSYSKNPLPVEVFTKGVSDDPRTFCKFDAAVNNLTTWAYLSVTVTPPLAMISCASSVSSASLSEDEWVDVLVDEDTSGECPVCMEVMLLDVCAHGSSTTTTSASVTLGCGHRICSGCFMKVNRCPLCRAPAIVN
jgi:hypothetical protein